MVGVKLYSGQGPEDGVYSVQVYCSVQCPHHGSLSAQTIRWPGPHPPMSVWGGHWHTEHPDPGQGAEVMQCVMQCHAHQWQVTRAVRADSV